MPAQHWELQPSADALQAAKRELDKHGDSCVHQFMSQVCCCWKLYPGAPSPWVLVAISNQNTGARDPQQVLPEQGIARLVQVTLFEYRII